MLNQIAVQPIVKPLMQIRLTGIPRLLDDESKVRRVFGLLVPFGGQSQVLGQDHVSLTLQHGSRENVPQLAHVSRPRVSTKRFDGSRVQRRNRPVCVLGRANPEIPSEQRQVGTPLAKRRQFDRERRQPKIQVFPKCPFFLFRGEIAIRRRNETNVHGDRC